MRVPSKNYYTFYVFTYLVTILIRNCPQGQMHSRSNSLINNKFQAEGELGLTVGNKERVKFYLYNF